MQETDDPAAALAAGDSFDAIAMWHVIEHHPHPSEVLGTAAAALRYGGVIVLAAPNPSHSSSACSGGDGRILTCRVT